MESMHSYVNDLIEGKLTRNELMKYELARFESFKGFPNDSLAMPLRLAQAGFYYMDNGEEAVCFECGLKYSSWNSQETPLYVHKRLRPSCMFVTGNGTRNVPIHCGGILARKPDIDNLQKEKVLELNEHKQNVAVKPTGASNQNDNLKMNEEQHKSSAMQEKELREEAIVCFETMPLENREGIHGENRQKVGHSMTKSHENTKATNFDRREERNLKTTSHGNGIVKNVDNRQQTQSRDSDISENKNTLSDGEGWPFARFQDYVTMTSRTETFKGWHAKSQDQTPDKMAEAGLVYVGFKDCVRCFYCGGGLQGWEAEDQPWVEHARWFPDCGYVLKCKGRDFVRKWHKPINNDNNEVSESDRKHMAIQALVETDFNRTEVNKSVEIYKRENVMKSVLDDNERLKRHILCKICLDNEAGVVFLPCGHLISCPQCASIIRKCPICRKFIKGVVRTYIS